MVFRRRQDLEQNETNVLAAYAVFSAQSRGRVHPEAEHEWRTCFQRDRDRILHSAAFRRLEAKTQVFLKPSKDYYRTRLTHTIEVAQIARTLARGLGANEDLAEATALAHDLGHPPYGHSGEEVLNELMIRHGGFEHNAQSLRTVEYLEHPYPAFRGLNLCYETRECMAKHQTRYDAASPREEFGTGQAPLEGQIADLADSIAYMSHDLDDALASELIGEEDLRPIAIYQELRQTTEKAYPDAHLFALQLRAAKGLIDLLILDAWDEIGRRLETQRPSSADQVRAAGEKIACLSANREKQLSQLGDFLLERVYYHPMVRAGAEQAKTELTSLFRHFLKFPGQLPPRYQQRTDEQGVHRVICDYLAGMTDRFCHQKYQEVR